MARTIPCSRGLCIPHKEKNKDHSDKRHQPRDDNDGVERVRCQGLMNVGEMTDQLEGDDGSDPSARSGHPAHRCHRIAFEIDLMAARWR